MHFRSMFYYSLLTLAMAFTLTQGLVQEIIFYNQDGNFFGFQTPVPNSRKFDFGNITKICAKGVWVLYGMPDYEQVLFGLSYTDTLRCWNQSAVGMNSFRHVGHKDTQFDTITLYTDKNFEGPEVMIDGIAYGGISTPTNSVAITGVSNWTVYDGTNFNGTSLCFTGSANGLKYTISLEDTLGQIGSVVKGCKN